MRTMANTSVGLTTGININPDNTKVTRALISGKRTPIFIISLHNALRDQHRDSKPEVKLQWLVENVEPRE